MEKLLNGSMTEEINARLQELVSESMNLAEYGKYSLPPFLIDEKKLKGKGLQDYLGLLRKNELEEIRKYHNIENASNIKKDALVKLLRDFLTDESDEFLAFIPSAEYVALLELMEAENVCCDLSEEIPEDINDLRSMGLVYSIHDGNDGIQWIIPKEIRDRVRFNLSKKEFMARRQLSDRIENAILCIFFYWGVVTRYNLMKEASRLLDIPMDDDFSAHFGRVFRYMTNSYIEKDIVGSMEFYTMFSEEAAQQVISDSWQKADYPEIPREALISAEDGGWMGFALQNPYFRLLYDIMTDIEENEQDEEFDPETAMDYISLVTHCMVNARPGTTTEQLSEKLELTNELKNSKEMRSLLNDMLVHSPNYWMKGNAVSGAVHLISDIVHKQTNKLSAGNGMKAAEKAAEKWKVGRNDPCPCGSGKKFKKCCM